MLRSWSSTKWLARALLAVSAICLAACETTPQSAPAASSGAGVGVKSGTFTTSDGVKLNYLEAGSGKPLVMIPGWSQTAAQFKHQLSGLSSKYHVIAIDMRGHAILPSRRTVIASIGSPPMCTSFSSAKALKT